MAVFPFIILKNRNHKSDKVLLNHEQIHLAQQKELLVIPFFLFYGVNYLVNLMRFRNHHKAYREIIFEKEAYQNERNLSYLQTRKGYSFMKHREGNSKL